MAVAQSDCILGDKQANLHNAERLIYRAKKNRADIIVFPEAYLTGYLVRDKLDRLAETTNGASVRHVCELARKSDICVVMGFLELEDLCVYNACLVADRSGTLLGVQRKLHLCRDEKSYLERGAETRVFETDLGKLGVMICYDLYFPEHARILALQKVDFMITCAADWKPWATNSRIFAQARALENQNFLVYCNRVGAEGKLQFYGKSCVVDPRGKVTADAGEDRPRLMLGTLDYSVASKFRNDIFYLSDRHPASYAALSRP